MTDIVERLNGDAQTFEARGFSAEAANASEASQEITRLREEVRVLSYQYKCACETVEAQHYALNKPLAPTSEPL